MKKVSFLLGVHTLSFFHKLRHDLIRELVVAFCSLILLALFYYVFNDFLNSQVKNISLPMRERFAETLTWILILASSLGVGRILSASFHNPRSLFRSTLFLGETPRVRHLLGLFHILCVLIVIYTPVWFLIYKVLLPWSFYKILTITLFMSILSLCTSRISPPSYDEKKKELRLHWSRSSQHALLEWRLQLLFLRNRLAQFCFLLFVLCSFMLFAAGVFSLPFVAAFALSFWGGFLASCALCFQFADDLESSRLEKSSGVSHQSFLMTLFTLALLVGSLMGTVNFVFWILSHSLWHTLNVETCTDALRIFFITALPSYIVPAVLFQIDGRRPVLSILASFLISLFITTAIYASWFALALLPLIAYYGFTSQEGRFYRS